ncbi:MAG: alpha-amylase, partial [Candidatus Riflebacteria bacterium]
IFNLGNYKHPFRMDNDNPCAPEWFKDFLIRDQWGAGPLVDPITGATFPKDNLHPERFFGTDESLLDPSVYHQNGWLENPASIVVDEAQNQHLHQNMIDLATDRWSIKNYFRAIGIHYINRGVDGFRVQFARNINRDDLRQILEAWVEKRPDLMVIADVSPIGKGFGRLYGETEPSELVPWWYSRTTQYDTKPDLGKDSGIAVFDYGLFRIFADSIANGHFGGTGDLIARDWAYGDPNTLITFFHNFEMGPESGNLTRFSGEEWKAACAYNLLWTIRGVPCLFQGEEIGFKQGMPQKLILPEDRLENTGLAYFGDYLEPDQITNTISHNLWRHIYRLNQMREAIPALSYGKQENGSEFVSGMSFVRNYNNSESYAVVGLSAFIDQEITVQRVLPGTYSDAVTGETQTVATSTR